MKKSFTKTVWDSLGSRDLSVFIFIMGLTYLFVGYIFSTIVPPGWFDSFQSLLPLLVMYTLFFINLVICEIKWIPVAIGRCRQLELPRPDNLKRFGKGIGLDESYSINSLKQSLSKSFFRIKEYEVEGKSVLFYIRGLTAPLGNIIFHISFLFLLAGILVGLLYRVEGSFSIIEGRGFDGTPGFYNDIKGSPLSELPYIKFTLDSIIPEFWEGELLFTDLRADLTMEDGSKGSSWLSEAIGIDGASVTVNGIGYAISYNLKDREGKELKSGTVSMPNLFAPGMEDTLTIPGYPHRFLVAYYPDAKINGSNISNLSMNRKNPVIGLRVYRGRLPVFTGLLREGEEAEFDNHYISFPEVKYRGDFKFVKDSGFYFIWIAFVMMISGLVWRFLFCRKEVLIIEDKGEYSIYLKSEYFPLLFEKRIREMAGQL
ncbi:MAG: cytochrome c biogenesis protein ResB [bacterium]|nr:cytochrome c biogenesis protein ResB [bacterium]